MGGTDKRHTGERRQQQRQEEQEEQEGSDQESNETMPIHSLPPPIYRNSSGETSLQPSNLYQFLKYKPIKRRGKRGQGECREKLRLQVRSLTLRVQELEDKLSEARRLQDACPHCHFYLSQPPLNPAGEAATPHGHSLPNCFPRSPSKDSLEFEKIDFQAPLMYSQEMEEKSWIFLGTILIAMGSKVMDTDGTVNVFKIVKESVDQMRRQVDKSAERLSMDFFLGKQELEVADRGMEELDFDPFYQLKENPGGLQLESVRVQSVEQYELFFDQKMTFNIKYDALITAIEYMKENSSLSFT